MKNIDKLFSEFDKPIIFKVQIKRKPVIILKTQKIFEMDTRMGERICKIKTYNDLAKECYGWAEGSRADHLGEEDYRNFLLCFSGIGVGKCEKIINHLKTVNFPFSVDYAKKVYEYLKNQQP